jgi:hypothetical protein
MIGEGLEFVDIARSGLGAKVDKIVTDLCHSAHSIYKLHAVPDDRMLKPFESLFVSKGQCVVTKLKTGVRVQLLRWLFAICCKGIPH